MLCLPHSTSMHDIIQAKMQPSSKKALITQTFVHIIQVYKTTVNNCKLNRFQQGKLQTDNSTYITDKYVHLLLEKCI